MRVIAVHGARYRLADASDHPSCVRGAADGAEHALAAGAQFFQPAPEQEDDVALGTYLVLVAALTGLMMIVPYGG